MTERTAPRSLLVGWGNATSPQLVAYERLHRALGLTPTTIIPSTAKGLVRPDAYAEALAPTAAMLAAAPHRPTVVHLFSDNGFIGWAALLTALASTEDGRRARDAIRGVVLDSSPGLWAVRDRLDFARRFARGMTPAVARILGRDTREHLFAVTPLLRAAFVGYQLLFPRAVAVMRGAADRVAREQPTCAHLFLYGGADTLVPPHDVEAWIERQRARGVPVEAELFPRARHVALYPADPARYRAALARFFAGVLA